MKLIIQQTCEEVAEELHSSSWQPTHNPKIPDFLKEKGKKYEEDYQ
jgi:hypothetical protein